MRRKTIKPPRAGRPTRAHAEKRHSQLLECALAMFLELGYQPTTMDAIAASVNMTKRTIYARYQDKTALFLAAVQYAIERLIVPDATLRTFETDDLEGTLTAVARMRVAHVGTPEGMQLQRIINAESYRFPEIFTAAYEQATRPVIAFLADLFRRHTALGTIDITQPEKAATVFLSMVVSGPVRVMTSGHKLDPVELEERIAFSVALFLNGARSRKN